MKKLLLGSMALLLFSSAILIFQISCSKSVQAGTSEPPQQNKILYFKSGTAANGYGEIWTANYDGSNQKKIEISLPSGVTLSVDGGPKLSPDRQTIFFNVRETINPSDIRFHIYSCKIDGTNLHRVVEGVNVFTGLNYYLGEAY